MPTALRARSLRLQLCAGSAVERCWLCTRRARLGALLWTQVGLMQPWGLTLLTLDLVRCWIPCILQRCHVRRHLSANVRTDALMKSRSLSSKLQAVMLQL
jgi:hypothetical protein